MKFYPSILCYGLFLMVVNSCSESRIKEQKEPARIYSEKEEAIIESSPEDNLILYEKLLLNIETERSELGQLVEQTEEPGVDPSSELSGILFDSIFPYWYGTKWDYNGVTQEPRIGKIACGYFVTTTLEDAGFKLNRLKLAQMAASNMINVLCGEGNTKVIGYNRTGKLIEYLKAQEDGIFLLGLDNHVGFIHKLGEQIHFIHSSGIQSQQKVMKELLEESAAVIFSKAYYVSSLTGYKRGMEKWLKGERF